MEGGKVVGLHDPPFNETPDQRTDSRMNDNFGDDEDWQGNEKSDVSLNVTQERYLDTSAQGVAIDQGHEQQRQPRPQRDKNDPAFQEFQSVSGEMRPPEDLM